MCWCVLYIQSLYILLYVYIAAFRIKEVHFQGFLIVLQKHSDTYVRISGTFFLWKQSVYYNHHLKTHCSVKKCTC